MWSGRLAFVLGIVDTTDYVDIYGLVSPWADFNNLAFSNGPTMAAPSQGFGVAARGRLTDHLYLTAGVADANGDPSDPGDSLNSFFDTGEFFTHLELGWSLSRQRPFTDTLHVTAWHAEARSQAGTLAGWGVALSYSQLLGEIWEPFVRVGYADEGGALWQWSASVGLGVHLRAHDLLGLGLNWGRPAASVFGPDLPDQYTVEVYYRLQLTAVVTVTSDVQVLIDPALNPNADVVAVLGIRLRVAF